MTALEKRLRAECAQLVADYGERGDLLADCRVRASALEALLAECETVLKSIVDQIEDYERVNNLAPNPGRQDCWDSVGQAKVVLAKLKARTGDER